MESHRSTPVRKPHTSTADLLTWSETPLPESPVPPSNTRPFQPSDGISKVVFGGQVTEEEAESLNKSLSSRKPCSDFKKKEMTGSGIFSASEEDATSEARNVNPRPALYKHALASHISFSEEESVSPRKPVTLPEAAKQRELSGTLHEADMKLKKQNSHAKSKELSGHDIFASPPEILPRSFAPRVQGTNQPIGEETTVNMHTPNKFSSAGGLSHAIPGEEQVQKTAKKIYDKKFAELSGNDIFKDDPPPTSSEKPLSVSKQREMSGSNIFADGKRESREYFGGVRKPPGGESSIALV